LCFVFHDGVQEPCQNLSYSLFIILEKLEYNLSRKMKMFFHGLVSILWCGVCFLFYKDTGPFSIFTAIIVHYLLPHYSLQQLVSIFILSVVKYVRILDRAKATR